MRWRLLTVSVIRSALPFSKTWTPPEEPEEPEEPDPYLARKQGGRRVKEIPDLRKYLDVAK